MLRPLELDAQPLFYLFSSVYEREHQFVLYLRTSKVHKISVFKEHTLVCPVWKSQI